MQRRSKALLWDAREATRNARSFLGGRGLEEYRADDMRRSAVERQFTIAGEALAQLRTIDPETAALVPDIAKIIGFRNILIHSYGDVDQELVWFAASHDSAVLIDAITGILGEETADG